MQVRNAVHSIIMLSVDNFASKVDEMFSLSELEGYRSIRAHLINQINARSVPGGYSNLSVYDLLLLSCSIVLVMF